MCAKVKKIRLVKKEDTSVYLKDTMYCVADMRDMQAITEEGLRAKKGKLIKLYDWASDIKLREHQRILRVDTLDLSVHPKYLVRSKDGTLYCKYIHPEFLSYANSFG